VVTAAAIAGGTLSALYLLFAIGAFTVTVDNLAEPGLWLCAAIGGAGLAAAIGSRRRAPRLAAAGLHVALACTFAALALRGWRDSTGRYGLRPTELLTLALGVLEAIAAVLCVIATRRPASRSHRT
jgi:hypothetical protein